MMPKSKLNLIAKEIVMESLACAYYKLEGAEYSNLTDEEKEAITERINRLGNAMAKRIGEIYYTM